MQNKSILRIIKNDVLFGISSNKFRYILVILFFLCNVFVFIKSTLDFPFHKTFLQMPSVTDIWFNLFKGMEIYIPSKDMPFQIPFKWLMIQTLLALLIVIYPTQDLFSYGTQILIHMKKRRIWWISKCIWNICTVISFYLIAFICVLLISAIYGNISFNFNLDLNNEINYLDINITNIVLSYFSIYGLPIITSIALSLLQMMLSFILSPIYSFIITIAYSVISAYYCSPLLIGNFSMIMRNSALGLGSVHIMSAVIICCIVSISSIVIGMIYTIRLDIIKKGGVVDAD